MEIRNALPLRPRSPCGDARAFRRMETRIEGARARGPTGNADGEVRMSADMASLITPVIPALRRYARALLRDRAAADDLVQDCLERAVGRWHQRREDGDARAWIFAILHNLAMTRLRRASARPQAVPIEEAGEGELAHAAPQEEQLHYQDALAALGHLPEEQRAVLLLVGVEDLSYAQAAKVLDIPVGTVMSRLSRARERLHDAMSDHARRDSAHPHLRRVK